MENSYLKKEADMTDRIIEREFICRSVELKIRGNEMILSSNETVIKGKIKMETEFSEKLTGKKKKAMESFIKNLQKHFKPGKLNPQAGGILFETCPKCGGIVTLQGREILQKVCSVCGAEYHPQVFG